MRLTGRIKAVREEHGAVAVLVAIVMPILLILTSFAIDGANFWVHRRHLQTQADAAALAGGAAMQVTGCNDATILAAADVYAGVPGSTYNKPKSTGTASRTSRTHNVSSPCTATPTKAVDITVRERDFPVVFPVPGLTGHDVSAH